MEATGNGAGVRLLGRAVLARRSAMRLDQRDLQARGGPGEVTVRNVELGQAQPSDLTLAKLDVSLDWAPDTAAILSGRLPATSERIADVYDRASTMPRAQARANLAAHLFELPILHLDQVKEMWLDGFMTEMLTAAEYGRRRSLPIDAARRELLASTHADQIFADQPKESDEHEQRATPTTPAGGDPANRDIRVRATRAKIGPRELLPEPNPPSGADAVRQDRP